MVQNSQRVLYVSLFVYLRSYLLPGDSEVTFTIFESSCHLLLLV